MAYFLSQSRRECLVANLGLLHMPRPIAESHACLSDGNLVVLDKHISAIIWRVAERFERLNESATRHNLVLADSLAILLASDTLLLAAFIGEAKERNIPQCSLPRVAKALDHNAEELGAALAMILANSVVLQ